MAASEDRRPDLVPAPRAPRTARGWKGWLVVLRMSVVAALGVAALLVLAIPDFGSCCHGCETSAISTLRNISSAQSVAVANGVIDADGDGRAEYAGFRELSASIAPRGGDAPIDPPVLSGAFRTTRDGGCVRRAGWSFRLYLRTADGTWISPDAAPGDIDADAAETGFLCYAWVSGHSCVTHGHRTFVLDETGAILATSDRRYAGPTGPRPDAAPGAGHGLAPGLGADGNTWKRVN